MRLLCSSLFSLYYFSLLILPHGSNAFVSPSPRVAVSSRTTALASTPEPKESDDDRKRRMELVRNLQNSYYKSENGDAPTLDVMTGVMENVFLWRVPWTELPGRSNILNVHDPTYTNMFETILNRPKPWYFGHLFMPGGSKNLRSGEYEFELKNWRDDAANVDRSKTRTSVVGTLMKIADFRRLEDGRLCILVHAMDRFVVKDALQNLPFSIANVHILPDYEALNVDAFEEQSAADRARATVESFQYHDYEYYEKPLPLPEKDNMSQTEVYGSWLTDVLPFVPYSLDDAMLPAKKITATEASPVAGVHVSLETRLVANWILKDPLSHPNVVVPRSIGMSNDDLEKFLWNAMEDFCGAKGVQISPNLLCLLPQGRSWLPGIPDAVEPSSWQRVSSNYPADRRQARLSYAAAALVELTGLGMDMRQVWLETPSTNARLADLLERFEVINARVVGEFQ